MASEFNLDLLKKHPYATGAVVIVGGIIVFYLLSSSSSSSSSQSSSPFGAELQASEQQQQLQAQEDVQAGQNNAAIAQSQIAAGVSNAQTAASLQINDENTAAQLSASLAQITGSVGENQTNDEYTTIQQANQELSEQNQTAMQDQVLESQINSGVIENANNNATALAGSEYTTNAQVTLGTDALGYADSLAGQKESDFEKNVQTITPLAGQKKNSITDADNQTALFQTILSGGSSGVAAAGDSVSTSTAKGADASSIGAISGGISSLLGGLFG